MISTIKQFFEKHIASGHEKQDSVPERSLHIATTALLIEMMRADEKISDPERKIVTDTIRSKFGLSNDEIRELMELAEEEIWKSTGYFEFTSLMNKYLSYREKVKVVEHLWNVAFADAILDKHEEYMVRKIAHLIHVSHKDFIEAKLRVRTKSQKSELRSKE